jgi:F-type H+-transporting ATPase subunit b
MPLAGIFLIPNATFIVELVIFIVILGLVGKYVLPPLNRAMEKRQEEITASLAAAAAAQQEADETHAQREGILDEARQRAREIVAQGNKTAERTMAQAEERGVQEYDRMLRAAETDIALAKQRAVDEVSAQLGALALSVARQVIGREIDAASHSGLIEEAVAALRSSADTTAARSQN